MTTKRAPFPIDKRAWQPGLIPGPLTLVTTVDARGEPNLAPKSWVQMASFDPPMVMFSGQPDGRTEANILATGHFALNLVHGGLARPVFDCVRWSGAERVREAGFTLVPASKISAPLVDECRAWLECDLRDSKRVGSALVVFGEIVAASVRSHLLRLPPRQRYPAQDLALFLEDGLYATLDRARPAQPEDPGPDTTRWVYLLEHARPELFTEQLVRAHVAHLKDLESRGLLELCGPFGEGKGGMVILRGVTRQQARAIMEADPFVRAGAESAELREWKLSARENRHMGMG